MDTWCSNISQFDVLFMLTNLRRRNSECIKFHDLPVDDVQAHYARSAESPGVVHRKNVEYWSDITKNGDMVEEASYRMKGGKTHKHEKKNLDSNHTHILMLSKESEMSPSDFHLRFLKYITKGQFDDMTSRQCVVEEELYEEDLKR